MLILLDKKKMKVHPQKGLQAIKEETYKLLKAYYIREVQYLDWLENMVMVKKRNEKWRMCVDFIDHKKTCLEDNFPLPTIDKLVDVSSGHRILSFMDAFFGYNQIPMNPNDQEKRHLSWKMSYIAIR